MKKIVIVGAGIAGLSAAHELLQAGFSDVIILEGSNRVGGRIKSVKIHPEEGVVELGATCIHGASPENPLYNLASEWGMTDSLVLLNRTDGQYYQENGEIIEKSIVEQVWEVYLQMEENMEEIFQSRNKIENFSNSKTVAQYVHEVRNELLQQFPEGKKRDAASKAFNSMLNYCQFINGDELDFISADLAGQYKTIEGPDMVFSGNGYSGFLENLQNKIPDSLIYLNAEVTDIFWSQDIVEIICKNGSTYRADHVIVTCPLGHLKATYKQMFKPELPDCKASAIENIGFGRVTKLFLFYEQPFWKEGIKLAWTNHGEKITKTSDWVREIIGFREMPTSSKIIGNPIAGKGAEILEGLSDDEVSTMCSDLLKKFLQDPSIPKPTKILRSGWINDPLYRGTYSYLNNKSHAYDIHNLAAPLPDETLPVLLFAGEATHPDYYSTVHGAYLSGIRESQRLIDLYKS